MNVLEITVLLALALIVLGPDQLPEVLRTTGKMLRELRAASNTLMRELTEVTEEPRRTIQELNPLKPEDKPGETRREP